MKTRTATRVGRPFTTLPGKSICPRSCLTHSSHSLAPLLNAPPLRPNSTPGRCLHSSLCSDAPDYDDTMVGGDEDDIENLVQAPGAEELERPMDQEQWYHPNVRPTPPSLSQTPLVQ